MSLLLGVIIVLLMLVSPKFSCDVDFIFFPFCFSLRVFGRSVLLSHLFNSSNSSFSSANKVALMENVLI